MGGTSSTNRYTTASPDRRRYRGMQVADKIMFHGHFFFFYPAHQSFAPCALAGRPWDNPGHQCFAPRTHRIAPVGVVPEAEQDDPDASQLSPGKLSSRVMTTLREWEMWCEKHLEPLVDTTGESG